MKSTVIALLICTHIGTAGTRPSRNDVPADWPPLPDFKTRIDYAKWLENYLNRDIKNDARPLYNEIFEQETDSEETKQAKAKMWGEGAHGSIDGLFTGIDDIGGQYAWDPVDHPEWEEAYQAQIQSGLIAKLIEISQRKSLSFPLTWSDPASMTAPHRQERENADEPIDWGLTKNDKLFILALFPSLASQRMVAKVLMQDAWRAPGGKVDPDAMIDALSASLRIADQVGCLMRIDYLINIAIRELVYTNTLQALQEHVFDPEYMKRFSLILSRNDNNKLTELYHETGEAALVLDFLQFAYELPSSESTDPKPNRENVLKLFNFFDASHRLYPELDEAPLDLVEQIDQCDPRAGVKQLITLFTGIREYGNTELPLAAVTKTRTLIRQFKADPKNHVIVRQCANVLSLSAIHMFAAKAEARRRATHLVYRLHRELFTNGKWPDTLQDLPHVPTQLLIDPFSGKEFVYRIENGEALVYSVAANGIDDGGKHDRQWGLYWKDDKPTVTNTDYVFWPVPPRER